MVAMVLFAVLMIALLVALFAWQPWDDDTTGGGTGTEQQQGEGGIDIEGDIDIDPNAPQTSPGQ
jgi:hypothetical protein